MSIYELRDDGTHAVWVGARQPQAHEIEAARIEHQAPALWLYCDGALVSDHREDAAEDDDGIQ